MLGLRFCARALSSCGKQVPLFIAVRGPLTIAASLAAEHRLQMRRLSSCGSRAQPLHGMWDPPRPGLEPVSPALTGRFSTTAPLGKPSNSIVASANSDAILIFFFLSMWLLTFLKLLGSSLSPGVLNFHINVPYWSFSHGLGSEWDISVEELTHFNFEKFFYMVYLIISYMCLRNSY